MVGKIILLGSLNFILVLPSTAQGTSDPEGRIPRLLRGGQQLNMLEVVQGNLVYPPQVVRNHLVGRVLIAFIVTKNGSVKEAHVAQSFQPACDAAALKAVRALPQFEPLLRAGRPVVSELLVPVSFDWRSKPQAARVGGL